MEGKDTKRNSETMQETMQRILADPEKASQLAVFLAELAEPSEVEEVTPQKEEPEKEMDLEVVVTDYLHAMGMPAHIKGYHYARAAIMMVVNDSDKLNFITKVLYPSVATMYKTTPSRVERAIRHSIELAWSRGEQKIMDDIFGYTINSNKGKPTNSEFIAMVADHIRLQMK